MACLRNRNLYIQTSNKMVLQLQERPLFFITHNFGGTILAHVGFNYGSEAVN
jgi:hypothetical protein